METEAKVGRHGRIADGLARVDLLILDELGYLPFAQSGGQLLFHLISRLYERTLSERLSLTINLREPSLPPTSPLPNGRASSVTPRRVPAKAGMTTALLDRLTITATGNDSWRFKNRS